MNDENRHCPRGCGELRVRESRGIEVDLCDVCGGIWLDFGEFDPLVARRFSGEELETYFALTAQETTAGDALKCPHEGAEMYVVDFDDMELDWCPDCHGIWIDGGERAEIARASSSAGRDRDVSQVEPKPSSTSDDDTRGQSGYDAAESADTPAPGHDGVAARNEGRSDAKFGQGAFLPQGDRMIDLESAPDLDLGSTAERTDAGGHPGLREIEFQGGEPIELELDHSSEPSGAFDDVHCASCGGVFPTRRTLRMMDANWCETCVVEGDYPGSNGPPVARRIAEAAQAMSAAKNRLEESRQANKAMGELSERRRRRVFNKRVQWDDLSIGVHATARTLKSLFVKDD